MKKWFLAIVMVVLFLPFVQPIALNAEQTFDSVVLRGSAEALDWSSNDHPLTYDEEENVWVSEPIELTGGEDVEYKFVYDSNWMPGENLVFTPSQDGEYQFIFHPDNERTVDVVLANQASGSLILSLQVPASTPDWLTPTVAHSKNGFNYSISPMKQTGENSFQLTVGGEPGEELSYLYSLGGEAYKEKRENPRSATFSLEPEMFEDTVNTWEAIPVAESVTHDFNHTPYTPTKKDEVTLTVTVKHFGPVDNGAVYYTTDGSSPEGNRGEVVTGETIELQRESLKIESNELKTSVFTATIPKQKNDTRVKYKIDVWNRYNQGSQYADNGALTSDYATEFAYYVEDHTSPAWAKEAVIYQVFVDRFRDGNIENNTSVNEEVPYDEQLKGWMGGDLQGVIEKLDYIDDLGVNTIWVSPIYEGPYSHGYHPTDFMNIDPRFGSNQLMKQLVEEAHNKDIRIVYDLVPNHTSDQHEFFQDAVENGTESPYFDWYTFLNWPEEYETFYGINELPELNNDHPETRDYMLNEVVPFWMEEIGVDGFRLDYAKGPSQSFWVDFRDKVKELDSDAFIFGEVWDNLDTITSYKGKLDGAIDFETQGAIANTFLNQTSLNEVTDHLETINNEYGKEFIGTTFLDSHDMPRFLFEADGNTETLKQAASLQFALPGAPIIYYGDEIGLSQSGDHNEVSEWKDRYYREMMKWDKEEQNLDVKAHYQQLIQLRNDHPALTNGDFNTIYSEDDLMIFERSVNQEKIVIVVNRDGSERQLDLKKLYHHDTPNRVQLQSLLGDETFKSNKRTLPVTVDGASVSMYKVKGNLQEQEPSEDQKYSKVVVRGSAPLDWETDHHLLTFDDQESLWKSAPIELTAGETLEYKFVRDGEWLEGDNLTFTPETDGSYILYFDPTNERNVDVQKQTKEEAA
ncbi:glycoside hydrolase family 13 protein [Halobacillus locisalis]|uniref:Glycoside hydrolase family 13 protein n=1 Tax=Halobacillus locisalis TaxID=220753 RepID=A0A838CUQ2_9BACI|nr:alpha-amylase family glycosyl hydrolase [Halobacillus locisalis]MBA2175495.1 glycoside hydrolase family 13 protein [Halobacillus locisalis]